MDDKAFFDEKYKQKVSAGEWAMRTDSEKEKIFENYIVYKVNGRILGGFSLSDIGGNVKLLECIFSDQKGVGSIMLNNFIKKQGNIYAYSHKQYFFLKNGFVQGQEISDSGACLFKYKKEV